MEILQDQGKASFAKILLTWLTDSTRRWISPEGLVIGTPVVITGEPKKPGNPQDEKRRREAEKAGVPGRLGPEECVRRRAEQLGRIKRRDIGAKGVVVALPRRPGGVNQKRA